MEVTNTMESSSTLKCSKKPMTIDNEQDLYLSIQPNVNNPKLLLLVINFFNKTNILYLRF